jgi:AcrR family transcriptional regulator
VSDKRRRYKSPTRQAQSRQTRTRVLAAAHDLFVRRGFTVTIGEIAAQAGVSSATIELLFGTKAALLNTVVDVALAGDDEPVPILDRRWVHDLKTRGASDFLASAGTAFAAGAHRVAPVLRAVDEASARSTALTELTERLAHQRRVMATYVVSEVVSRDALATDLTATQATETVLVLLDPMLHRRLLIDQGWSTDRFGTWLGRSLQRLLLDPPIAE